MNYKPSKYIIHFDGYGEFSTYFNTHSRKTIIPKDKKSMDSIENYITSKTITENTSDSIFTELVKNGYLIDENIDEMNAIQFEINSLLYGNDELCFTIIPTDACNFDCVYCYQHAAYHTMSMATEEIFLRYIDKQVNHFKSLRINWFGGEPLLQKSQIIRMMEKIHAICKRDGVAFLSQMTTNGYGLDEDTFSCLVSNHLVSYQITLDGPEITHDTRRILKNGDKTFTVILNNLQKIRDFKPKKYFKIIVRVNVDNQIIEYLDEFLELYKYEFGNDSRFELLLEAVQDWGGDKIDYRKEYLINEGKDVIMETLDNIATKKAIKTFNNLSSNINSSICFASKKNGFVLNYDGKLYKCPQALYDRNISYDFNCVGYIDSKGFMVVDTGRQSNWVGSSKILKCDQCVVYPICFGTECPYGIRFNDVRHCRNYDLQIKTLSAQVRNIVKQGKAVVI